MIKNDLILRVLEGQETERPPVWLMRQAGRILPEYRALRSKLSGFIELVQTPHLAAEVTVQPVDRLGVDAAIIFSDILVIPECMGLEYELIEKKGPYFPTTIQTKAQIDNLSSGSAAADHLDYVYKAIEITKKALDNRIPLIVFAGAPWTLLSYMIEGQGSKTFSKAKRFLYQEPELAHNLLQKITDTIIAYLELKVKAGGDIIQLFDSWAGILNKELYNEFSLPYVKQIADHFKGKSPFIFFPKGAYFAMDDIKSLDVSGLGVDWTMNIEDVRSAVGAKQVLQGNLDPVALFAPPEEVIKSTKNVIEKMGKHHIMNLGHGVYPDTPLEHVISFVDYVKSYRY